MLAPVLEDRDVRDAFWEPPTDLVWFSQASACIGISSAKRPTGTRVPQRARRDGRSPLSTQNLVVEVDGDLPYRGS